MTLYFKGYQKYDGSKLKSFNLLSPPDPDVIFYTCPPRGAVITHPHVKSIIPIEMYVFSSCCEIFQKLYHTLWSITKVLPNFDEYLYFTG